MSQFQYHTITQKPSLNTIFSIYDLNTLRSIEVGESVKKVREKASLRVSLHVREDEGQDREWEDKYEYREKD